MSAQTITNRFAFVQKRVNSCEVSDRIRSRGERVALLAALGIDQLVLSDAKD